MKNNSLRDAIVSEEASIKDVMRAIDHSGLRVAYIVDKAKKLMGAISDSEIRKAILNGIDIRKPAKSILNPNPILLRTKDLSNRYLVVKKVRKLLDRMPDSRYILILDEKGRPKKMMLCSELIGRSKVYKNNQKSIDRSVLITGGAGYLGSVLVRRLLARGFKVKVLDILMYGIEPIEELLDDNRLELIEGDMRNISTLVRALVGVDAVINLAAVVGDPACKNKPEITIETNYLANKTLAEACKYHQINRFIYASTCSVYGRMEDSDQLEENSPLNPVSLYARTKIHSEEGILALQDENFSPTILRLGTLYGLSPRMRFDLVVNTMTKTAVVDKKISVYDGGKQWRPLLDVEDASEAYLKCLEYPITKIKGEVFNVGSDKQNYQVLQIAEVVSRCVPTAKLVIEKEDADSRNYFVSFKKIEEQLKFKANISLEKAVIRIKEAILNREIDDVNDPRYYNNLEYNP